MATDLPFQFSKRWPDLVRLLFPHPSAEQQQAVDHLETRDRELEDAWPTPGGAVLAYGDSTSGEVSIASGSSLPDVLSVSVPAPTGSRLFISYTLNYFTSAPTTASFPISSFTVNGQDCDASGVLYQYNTGGDPESLDNFFVVTGTFMIDADDTLDGKNWGASPFLVKIGVSNGGASNFDNVSGNLQVLVFTTPAGQTGVGVVRPNTSS